MTKFIILFLMISCGKIKHEIKPDPIKAEVGPNFEKAIELCDSRYGVKTPASEECFQDFRDYFKIKVSIDLDNIEVFCTDRYTDVNDQNGCIEDFTDLLTNVLGS